jgi:hypothetical protein
MTRGISRLFVFVGGLATIAIASTPSGDLQNSTGGMATYGYSLQNSTGLSQTQKACSDWNAYILTRSQWSMSTTLISRLANADWGARQAGAPTITSQNLANATNHLLANAMSGMTASQQQAAWKNIAMIQTPKGNLSLNYKYPFVSAVKGSDGRWQVTISASAFTQRKQDFKNLAPGMLNATSATTFYPADAMLVFYSVATADMGFGGTFTSRAKSQLASMTGLDMTTKYLFGETGYLVRRPCSTYLTQEAMSQFFSDLGF